MNCQQTQIKRKGEQLQKTRYKLRRFQCSYLGTEQESTCAKTFSSRQRVRLHIKVFHLKEVPQFLCQVEGCSFATHEPQTLQSHVRMHRGERPYRCRICDKAFLNAGNRNDHEKRHIKHK